MPRNSKGNKDDDDGNPRKDNETRRSFDKGVHSPVPEENKKTTDEPKFVKNAIKPEGNQKTQTSLTKTHDYSNQGTKFMNGAN